MQNNTDAWNLVNNSRYLIDGKYLLGGTQVDQTNEIANLYAAGVNTYTSRQYQFDMGVDVDLSMLLKGLSFQTRLQSIMLLHIIVTMVILMPLLSHNGLMLMVRI